MKERRITFLKTTFELNSQGKISYQRKENEEAKESNQVIDEKTHINNSQ